MTSCLWVFHRFWRSVQFPSRSFKKCPLLVNMPASTKLALLNVQAIITCFVRYDGSSTLCVEGGDSDWIPETSVSVKWSMVQACALLPAVIQDEFLVAELCVKSFSGAVSLQFIELPNSDAGQSILLGKDVQSTHRLFSYMGYLWTRLSLLGRCGATKQEITLVWLALGTHRKLSNVGGKLNE